MNPDWEWALFSLGVIVMCLFFFLFAFIPAAF